MGVDIIVRRDLPDGYSISAESPELGETRLYLNRKRVYIDGIELEEIYFKRGQAPSARWLKSIGCTNKVEKWHMTRADTILRERAQEVAKDLTKRLTPKIIDLTKKVNGQRR
ncbi:MAG: hypothetical protein WC548_04510 [Candidatus Pacearchaeota archaeon]